MAFRSTDENPFASAARAPAVDPCYEYEAARYLDFTSVDTSADTAARLAGVGAFWLPRARARFHGALLYHYRSLYMLVPSSAPCTPVHRGVTPIFFPCLVHLKMLCFWPRASHVRPLQ